MKIDIAAIQETHRICSGEWGEGNTSSIQQQPGKMKMVKGGNSTDGEIKRDRGVAIVITKELSANIIEITRANWRIMKIRPSTNIHGGKITILNTYAPHLRYNTVEREEYRAKVGETLHRINTKDCLIWGTDNNGQVAQWTKEKGINKCVGKWTISRQTEQGD